MNIQCLSGKKLFQNKKLNQLEMTISNLVSVPKKVYESLYVCMLHRFAEFCQAMPFSKEQHADNFGLIERQLHISMTVLKLRRGLYFPKNAETEVITAEEAQWTFALFSVALMKHIYQIETDREIKLFYINKEYIGPWSPLSGCLYEENIFYEMKYLNEKKLNSDFFMAAISGRIIPAIAFRWLSENNYLYKIWWDSILQQKDEVNEIDQVIEEALLKLNISKPTQNINKDHTNQIVDEFFEFIKLYNKKYSSNIFITPKGLFISEYLLNELTRKDEEKLTQLLMLLNNENLLILNKESYRQHQFRSKKFDDFTILNGFILDIKNPKVESIAKLCDSRSDYIENIKI